MLLQILRNYLSSATHEDWLLALSHPLLAPVFEAMQTSDEQTWTLEAFAAVACMSRLVFSLRFKKKVGVAPMVYLMHWRMQIACELPQTGNASVCAIAASVGYGSESAFSAAFFKVLKCRPGAYRETRRF